MDEGEDKLQALEPLSADLAPATPREWAEIKRRGCERSKGMRVAFY